MGSLAGKGGEDDEARGNKALKLPPWTACSSGNTSRRLGVALGPVNRSPFRLKSHCSPPVTPEPSASALSTGGAMHCVLHSLVALSLLAASPLTDALAGARSQIVLNHEVVVDPTLHRTDSAASRPRSRWQSIGPFPIGTREYPILPPFLPSLNQSSFPSPFVFGAEVGWNTVEEDRDGWIRLGDKSIDWNALRWTAGWSTLQHRVHYHRVLTIPRTGLYSLHLQGGATEFCLSRKLQDRSEDEVDRRWYNGNVYDYKSNLGHLVRLERGRYDLRVDYVFDIRVSGEPPERGVPTGKWRLDVEEQKEEIVVRGQRTTVPSLVKGWIMGDVVGVEVSNLQSAKITIKQVRLEGGGDEIVAFLSQPVTIAPGQTRLVAIHLRQKRAIRKMTSQTSHEVQLNFSTTTFLSNDAPHCGKITFPIVDSTLSNPAVIISTYLSNSGAPTYASFRPPRATLTCSPIVVLALHGAGVDPATAPEWASSIKPRQEDWIVFPLGLTEWGYDWQGPSLHDSFSAVHHLKSHLKVKWAKAHGLLEDVTSCEVKKLVVLGHSNGGQGAWYLMSRYPDLVAGGVPAAGYVKIQDYVPYHLSVGHHYRDPSLAGGIQILISSLASFDNDLYASNLVGLNILARHGSIDDNVPVQHSRQYVTTVREWATSSHANASQIQMSEVPETSHWWDSVFRENKTQHFIDDLVESAKTNARNPEGLRERDKDQIEFTLTTANPHETGSKHGFLIKELETPGRLARLHVKLWTSEAGLKMSRIETTNVYAFSIGPLPFPSKQIAQLSINVQPSIDLSTTEAPGVYRHFVQSPHDRTFSQAQTPPLARPYGPLLSILTTPHPLRIVIGTQGSSSRTEHLRSIARRIASDAYLYGRVDSIIQDDVPFLEKEHVVGESNLVLLGDSFSNSVTNTWEKDRRVPVTFLSPSAIKIHDRVFQAKHQGIIYLAPHPFCSSCLTLVLSGTDSLGLERAYRLFPFRTGVSLPEWVVSSGAEDGQKGGIEAAGFWGRDWGWSESMSFL
ncbi:BZ3500_MvSof-1268-A1-R1_Chr8-1g09984 [Microbotryum saponariae]|uniref:BZ3500_MvSof-1268-A1-R1_Chr8-1g09984 protein n=1 Tax=Microbotryum saponariae TaxID=289078 RepID=A0A2X0LRQ0_9BASI|nr:BZ3500_MvSof-1268-A1-R1_Chr8-1g09984 [Microbotryum saponariae]SDA08270.1 BZ3501_MvSof-1269-A2-R1_Chr8-1g09707 [Microbotryum saponariae]